MEKSNFDLMKHVDKSVVEKEFEAALQNLTLATCRYEGVRAVYLKFFKPKHADRSGAIDSADTIKVKVSADEERFNAYVDARSAPMAAAAFSHGIIGKADLAMRTAWWAEYFRRQELLHPLDSYSDR